MALNLKEKYQKEITKSLQEKFGYKNIMQVPKLEKVVINRGLGKGVGNAKFFDSAIEDMQGISKEGRSVGFNTQSLEAALEKYMEQMSLVKSGQRIKSLGDLVDGAVRLAGDDLEIEFRKTFFHSSKARIAGM